MATTHTGSFPIGFRRGGSGWQVELDAVIQFAKRNDFEAIDIAAICPTQIKQIQNAGLKIGSIDLVQPWGHLGSPDAGKRRKAVEINSQYIREVVQLGVKNFFTCVAVEDETQSRRNNFSCVAESYSRLAEAIAPLGAKIVIEGYPGSPPYHPNFACTPADYHALFSEVDSDVIGVNFDPSHLIFMGIDPIRFLDEFAQNIFHAHAKDTQLLAEGLYQHGNTQMSTFVAPRDFGGHFWRYTIPGHGCAPWHRILSMLTEAGYRGLICVELEDENFNGSEEGEKRGLIASRQFLENV